MNIRVQEEAPYSVSEARYAKGQLAVRCTAGGPYKDRTQRLIGDGLNCRWSGRERAFIASPSKVAKFEALHAAGFDACSFSGALYPPDDWRRKLTVAEAMRLLRRSTPLRWKAGADTPTGGNGRAA